jgi:hypothetical protein
MPTGNGGENKPQYRPFDTAEELRIAVFGAGGDWIVGG